MNLIMGTSVQLNDKTFEIVGIDDYRLTNSTNGERSWISYTLLSADGERTWISLGVAGELFTQWAKINRAHYQQLAKSATIDLDLTGIARITFNGDKGHSTPGAELVWARTNSGDAPDFLVIERFLRITDNTIQPLEPYLQTGTVLKNFRLD